MYCDNELIVTDIPAGSTGLIPNPNPPKLTLNFPLIPQSEWADRIKAKSESKTHLSNLRGNIPSRDQNGYGYCWAHSPISALLLARAAANLPYADLSPFAIGCIIKDYRNEGGWGALATDFLIKRGCPTSKYWPQQSTNRANDNPDTWADAAQYKATEYYMDNIAVYDRNISFAQAATALLLNYPCVLDYNWWGHSVAGADLVNGQSLFGLIRTASGKLATLSEFHSIWEMNDPVTAGFGIRIWNSWGDSWSDRGMGILTPAKSVPDGGLIIRY